MSAKKLFLVSVSAVLIILTHAGVSLAQEPTQSHIDAAKRTIAETGSTNRLDNILPQIAQNAKSQLIRTQPDKEGIITDIVDTETLGVAARRGDLEVEVVRIFTRVFTEQELNTIGDFFSTEAGKKFLTQSPIVVQEIDRASRVWSNGVARDLNVNIQARMKEVGLQ